MKNEKIIEDNSDYPIGDCSCGARYVEIDLTEGMCLRCRNRYCKNHNIADDEDEI